jgi:tetratricopeptide (TPR) repeat protein
MTEEIIIAPKAPSLTGWDKFFRFFAALAAALLNLSGLGLGYILTRSWLRWRIHILITAALMLGLYATKAYHYQQNWPIVLAVWLFWMFIDGWGHAWRKATRKPGSLKAPWLGMLLALVIFGVEWFGFFYYNLEGLATFRAGNKAYLSNDCRTASVYYQRVSDIYRLSLSFDVKTAEDRIEECRLMIHVQNSFEQGFYSEALAAANRFMDLYPQSAPRGEAEAIAAAVYRIQGESLLAKGNFEAALASFQTTSQKFNQPQEDARIQADLAGLYLRWGDQYLAAGDLENATQKYQKVLDDYPSSQAAGEAGVKLAGAYAKWGSSLYQQGDTIAAMEKFEVVLGKYSWITSILPGTDIITRGFTDWGDALIKEGKYDQAIGKFQDLLTKYRSTTAPGMLQYRISEIYYQWATELRNTSHYEAAFQKYGILTGDYGITPAGQRAKIEVPDTYFEWVTYLQKAHRYPEALVRLNEMIVGFEDEALKEKARVGIIDNYYLWADYLSAEQKYIEALRAYAKIKELVSDPAQVEKLDSTYQYTLTKLANMTDGQGYKIFSDAYTAACGGQPSSSPALDLLKDQAGKSLVCPGSEFNLPVDLWATKPADFRYVVKATYSSQEVERCSYSSGYTLIRMRYYADVTVISVVTGQPVATERFYGSFPINCGGKFFFTQSEQQVFGTTDFGYEDWLRRLSTYAVAKP